MRSTLAIALGICLLLIPGSISATTPSQVVTREQVIEPRLEYALHLLQTTPFGREVYAWFVGSSPDLILGSLDGWVSYYYPYPRSTIVIDEDIYREESQDVVAALIAHETTLAIARNEAFEDGIACIEYVQLATKAAAGWWKGRFNSSQRPNRTGMERQLSRNIYTHGEDGKWGDLIVESSEAYRESCRQFGPLTPLPWDLETKLLAYEIERNLFYVQLRPHLLRWWNDEVPVPREYWNQFTYLHNYHPLGYDEPSSRWLDSLRYTMRSIDKDID